MCWVLFKLTSGLSRSLGKKRWKEFVELKIPSDDGIKIIANGGSRELCMHKSVITKISGSRVLQDSPQDIYKHLGFSNLLGSNLPSDEKDYFNSKLVDIDIILCVAKLMYLGSVHIHKTELQLFLSACGLFKIRNLNPVDSGQVEQIMMVGGANDEHQSDVRVTDGGDAMDINEQCEADLGASGGHQPGESNTDDRASYNEINELRVNPPRQEQQPDSEMNPPHQEQLSDSEMNLPRQEQQPDSEMNPPHQEEQPDSEMNPPHQEEQPDSEMNPPHQEEQPDSEMNPPHQEEQPDSEMNPPHQEQQSDSEMNPPREETQPDSDMTPVRRSSRKRSLPKRFRPWP